MTNTTPESLTGRTVHLLRGSKYAGEWTITATEDAGNGWLWIMDGKLRTSARPEDIFTSEAEARAAGRGRRKPRQPRQMQRLYGDFAQLAAFHGIRTDGSGKVNR